MPTILEKYNITNSQIATTVILIAYIVYLGFATTPVPNVINDTIMYGVSSYAPPTYVSNNQVMLGIALVILMFVSYKVKEVKAERVTERQFKEHLTRQIILKQEVALPDGKFEFPSGSFKIDKTILTKHTMRGETRIATTYIAQLIIDTEDEGEKYYIISGDPVNMMIDDIVETDEKLTYVDKCPDCGRFPDEKIILPEDLKKFKEIKKLMADE